MDTIPNWTLCTGGTALQKAGHLPSKAAVDFSWPHKQAKLSLASSCEGNREQPLSNPLDSSPGQVSQGTRPSGSRAHGIGSFQKPLDQQFLFWPPSSQYGGT